MLRRLVHGRLEVGVAEAAIAAAREQHAHTGFVQIGDNGLFVFVENLGARRHFQDDTLAVGAVTVLAHAVAAGRAFEVLLVAIVDQCVEAVSGFDPDIAATPSVAAIGAAEWDELLAPERDRAGAAVAGAHVDLGLIQEFHGALYGERTRTPQSVSRRQRSETRWSPLVRKLVIRTRRDPLPTCQVRNSVQPECRTISTAPR